MGVSPLGMEEHLGSKKHKPFRDVVANIASIDLAFVIIAVTSRLAFLALDVDITVSPFFKSIEIINLYALYYS